jgi:hypothetical protein
VDDVELAALEQNGNYVSVVDYAVVCARCGCADVDVGDAFRSCFLASAGLPDPPALGNRQGRSLCSVSHHLPLLTHSAPPVLHNFFVVAALALDNSVVVRDIGMLDMESETARLHLEGRDLVVAVVVVDLGGTKCDNGTKTRLEHTWSVHYDWRMSTVKFEFIQIHSVKKKTHCVWFGGSDILRPFSVELVEEYRVLIIVC